MASVPLFNGFYDGLYRFLQSVSVPDEYLLRLTLLLTSIDVNLMLKMIENKRKCAKSSIFVV